MNDNTPQKHCPFCGETKHLTVYADPANPMARVIMCNDDAGEGCGAMAPEQTWNRRAIRLFVHSDEMK